MFTYGIVDGKLLEHRRENVGNGYDDGGNDKENEDIRALARIFQEAGDSFSEILRLFAVDTRVHSAGTAGAASGTEIHCYLLSFGRSLFSH